MSPLLHREVRGQVLELAGIQCLCSTLEHVCASEDEHFVGIVAVAAAARSHHKSVLSDLRPPSALWRLGIVHQHCRGSSLTCGRYRYFLYVQIERRFTSSSFHRVAVLYVFWRVHQACSGLAGRFVCVTVWLLTHNSIKMLHTHIIFSRRGGCCQSWEPSSIQAINVKNTALIKKNGMLKRILNGRH